MTEQRSKRYSPFSGGSGSASGIPGGGPRVGGSGGVTGRAGAGIGGTPGVPSWGAPGCGWAQTGLLCLGTLQTWRLESSTGLEENVY